MGKITKIIQPKHKESLTPWLQEFVETATNTPLPLLPKFLATFPSRWPFPRGDLYHWISLLNRFDSTFEAFCSTYKLNEAPQMRDYGCDVLLSSSDQQWDMTKLSELGYSDDGDSFLVAELLKFTRMLLEHCGNRSIYASSSHLNDLLHSTDYNIVCAALQVGSELAKRYQASLKRLGMATRQFHTALLSNHYNIDLDRVQQLAQPFVKTPIVKPADPLPLATPIASAKSKEKGNHSGSKHAAVTNANDLCAIAKSGISDARWNGWGDIKVSYYPTPGSASQSSERQTHPDRGASSVPSTPTPLRRSNTTSAPQSTPRAGRQTVSDDSPSPSARSPAVGNNEGSTPGQKSLEIPHSVVVTTPIYKLIERIPSDAPKETKYEVLNRLRVAKALTGSVEFRQKALKARLLAIQNLAYIHIEPTFVEKVLRQDHDEPRRFQLVYQLAELIHPAADGTAGVPLDLQATVLSLLQAMTNFHTKLSDIFSALNATVNHGVLLYVIRKAVAEMKEDDNGNQWTDADEWRENLFQLTLHITMAMTSNSSRATPEIISAGLLDIMVEILTIRSNVAERTFPTLLTFLDNLVFNVQTSFQTLINANGLDAITDLITHEVDLGRKLAREGRGTASNCRSVVVDYEIPFYQQQNLKWLLKFIHHLMSGAFAYGGNTDRLLRNLVDKSALLHSLRHIIQNVREFGSLVWTHAVSILSDFLNNDPTSFAAISEAGLVQSFLESVTGRSVILDQAAASQSGQFEGNGGDSDSLEDPPTPSVLEADNRPHPPTQEMLDVVRTEPLARGIVPSSDAMNIVPNVLNAISLNNQGMKMVVASRAFDSFFETFESPEHVRTMENDDQLAINIGGHFDELARHHPALRPAISNAVLDMIARVTHLGRVKARDSGWGAKLLITHANGKELSADPTLLTGDRVEASEHGKGKAAATSEDMDLDMVDTASPQASKLDTNIDVSSPYKSITPYIFAVATFLSNYVPNSQLKQPLINQGAIEYLLDLCTSPSLPHDFGDTQAAKSLQSVISQLVESSPIVGLPSLIKRTQEAIDVLQPVIDTPIFEPYFDSFVKADLQVAEDVPLEKLNKLAKGTPVVKALLNAQSLIRALYQCFPYSNRAQVVTLHQVNVFDYYEQLVKSLGPLLRMVISQETAVQSSVPTSWTKKETPSPDRRGSSAGTRARTASGDDDDTSLPDVLSSAVMIKSIEKVEGRTEGPPSKSELSSPRFRNFQTLRVLLHSLMPTTFPLLQTLGKTLLSRRGERDNYCRSHHVKLAEGLADTILSQLQLPSNPKSTAQFNYWIIMLHTVHEMLLDRKYDGRHSDRQGTQVISPVLEAFKQKGGLEVLNSMLRIFSSEICKEHADGEDSSLSRLAVIAMKKILELYAVMVNGKVVHDSLGNITIFPRCDERRSEQLVIPNLVVELRMAILPVMRELWESSLVEKVAAPILAKIIDILKAISQADNESQAYKRTDKNLPPALLKYQPVAFTWSTFANVVNQLKALDYEEDLAREAVYRANGQMSHATEYCRAHKAGIAGPRNPIPEDQTPDKVASDESLPAVESASAPVGEAMVLDLPADLPPGLLEEEILGEFRQVSAEVPGSGQNAPNPLSDVQNGNGAASTSTTPALAAAAAAAASAEARKLIPKEDLDAERTTLRTNLIDRCLDVIRAHPDSTYEVSELMSAVVLRGSSQDETSKQEIGETLVNALMSFALDDDLKPNGRSIAAYAHLLSLLLQDRGFFQATVSTLRENVTELMRFLQVPSPSNEDLPPWIPYVLLVFEILLSDDEQPGDIRWKAPVNEEEQIESLQWPSKDVVVKDDDRHILLGAVLDILPRVGKEESLAISVLRVLVILTRNRATARLIGDKKNLQRLFVMTKQLSGFGSQRLGETRISSYLMTILRHVVEDEEIIKQIMRSEIRALFENSRAQRALDVPGYVRQLSHVALRDPKLFVEVSNEMIRLARFTFQENGVNQRQHVVLKEQKPEPVKDDVAPTVRATEDLSIQDVKPSTENVDKRMADTSLSKPPETKRPILENPDGVIHFLLCELLNYKEVDDKEPSQTSKESKGSNEPGPSASNGTADASENRSSESKDKKAKGSFKADEHPIFIYRCFLLHCLTELLQSYNRTKVEFINFKRSAPLQTNTPIKPRSSVLNYFLTELVCPTQLDTSSGDSLANKKAYATAVQAQNLLVALVSKTGEKPVDRSREKHDYDDEPDLLFVRKFVLDTILKAYKDASTSNEAFDKRYARMVALAEVMHLMMGEKDKDLPGSTRTNPELSPERSYAQLRRLMYEKGYLGLLTASIADIDLAFPPVKKTIKSILRVLRILTSTAIQLSHSNILPIASTAESIEDDIASATSLSDMEEDREETPDLYRNSALGMMEPGRDMEGDYSEESDDDDEEMYDEEYGDDEMEYEEGSFDGEENVSDEDEDVEGMDQIEGLPGDLGVVEVTMEEEDDMDEDDDDEEDMDEDDDIDEDDDLDSEAMDDMDDRIQIVDDDGNPLDDDGASAWESETDEDEDEGEDVDYEGEAQGLEEAQMHGLDDVDGLNQFSGFMRAMHEEYDEEVGVNPNNPYEDEEDDDEDDEEDMDDDYGFDDDYPDGGPPPNAALAAMGWETLVINDGGAMLGGHHHHRHRHGIRSPFPPVPFMMGGPRDPFSHFGGMSFLLPATRAGLAAGAALSPGVALAQLLARILETRATQQTAHAIRRAIPMDADFNDPDMRNFMRTTQRSERSAGNEDGLNPLLHRGNEAGRDSASRSSHPSSFVRLLGGAPHGDSPLSIINDLITSLPHMGRHGHALQFQISQPGHRGDVQEFSMPFPPAARESRAENRRDAYQEPTQAAFFAADSTISRWLEEAKMAFSVNYAEKAHKIVPAILAYLVPPAIELEKQLKAKEAERRKREEEDRKKREEEERKAREAREAEEKAAREKAEAQERERAEAAAAELAARAVTDSVATAQDEKESHTTEAMEGVETANEPEPESGPAEPAVDHPRVMTTIRGEQVDVTELGIDPDYLEALPEEFREEVIAQTISQRRSQAREAPRRTGESTEVFQEFLDALPDELRQEIVQQERAEQRRREREEARRQSAAAGQEAVAQDMDTASILMTFPPALREQVLMDQGADIMDSLPPDMAAEARRLNRTHPAAPMGHRERNVSGSGRTQEAAQSSGAADGNNSNAKPQRRTVVQMLDKPGVATLLRLMFINVKGGSLENSLRLLFKDVCENKQTRLEVISTLLQILQDGTTDVDAVERSFAQLSIKAKQPKETKDGKTPQSLKRASTNILPSNPSHTSSEISPVLIVQQCLDLLCYLAEHDVHVPSIFLIEQETVASTLKRTLSRKGKGKEAKAQKYAINSLLALLDRDLVIESSAIMDSLSLVLSRVTMPLLALDRKLKEAAEAIKKLDKQIEEPVQEEPATAGTILANDEMQNTEISSDVPQIDEANGAPSGEQPATSIAETTASDAPAPAEGTATESAADSIAKAQERKQFILKRIKQYIPPAIPVHNLTLIIKIFVARECSSKTFKETLSTIKNLSIIPGAMDVFGQELATQARILSEKIVAHLDELLPHIEKASSGTEIQGVALAKFSPGAADQNKLLRVLTALDHLFTQKKLESSEESERSNETKKQDLLAILYRNPTFNALWERLSGCLGAIRQRESLINVATILLPLIEALMVVCKDTTQSETPSQIQSRTEMMLSSPAPESQMASLFFTFTEEHRRILNELVRNNPSLMKGTFSHLVKNPKVLEFDNKRNYFNRSVHNNGRAPGARSFPTLQLSVRREHVFHDSFKSLYFKSGDEMKFGKLNIRFHGEEGVDAGGVTREWFQVLARQMFDPNYALFVPVSSDRTTFHPNKLSGINDEHLMFFKFIGRIIGKSLYEGRVLDCYFSRAVYKRILGKPVSVKDMESFDPDYYKSLVWMLENDITDIITETLSVEDDEFGVTRIEDLCENGRNIPVTEDNKHDYVRLVVEHKLLSSVKEQMEHFLKGFHEIIPAELIAIFNEQELELLISGLPDIDVDDWKSNTEYHNYTPSSQQIQWFWRALRSFDKEERAKLLQFVTGTSKVPLNGFKELEGMNGINRFNIHRDYGNKDRLPSSHTCFNQLDLPEYESYDTLRQQVLKAITAGSDYFGFA
ncbi:uncharacterized protein BCR38DRAFT_208474 [Pseudomassariella vexata]|uniref:HECT-type E3 ubiquitin transferase n=1 Tax=Pseudomassariella vexata TaxID=1141098 RepID=A0A1Y2DYG9_9PEZI|nr:uncharacterized protein BCR38DRAFT_208474 [Pseudomassariella vexata]ORY64156.1 hypothetical protein BCR38DRAFT_208474 [Pseudomassariella vexata]